MTWREIRKHLSKSYSGINSKYIFDVVDFLENDGWIIDLYSKKILKEGEFLSINFEEKRMIVNILNAHCCAKMLKFALEREKTALYDINDIDI